jgi:hypothetical protein
MRKTLLITLAALAVAVGTAATWASAGARRPSAAATPMHSMAGMKGMKMQVTSPALATALSKARLATGKYVTNLNAAKAAGYSIITKMIPDMGYHFLNGKITGFDPAKPPILVYEKRGTAWQLAALEWVFTAKPKTAPLPGARYGAFPAACHYADGTFVAAASQDACATTAPGSGAKFTFWHPNLITLHVWLWYPNPSGIYASMNPLVHPFNAG